MTSGIGPYPARLAAMENCICGIAMWLLVMIAPSAGFAQDPDPLLQKLMEKGTLSAQDLEDIRRQRAQNNVSLPFSLKFGGRIQLRFAAQQNDQQNQESEDSFRVRTH